MYILAGVYGTISCKTNMTPENRRTSENHKICTADVGT